MKPEDAEEYTQALGQVVAGGWRQIALGQRLGPVVIGEGAGRIGWAHRSCNRSKGTTEVPHQGIPAR